eukprot:scaffold36749_cov19-Tisochrysis_lutea.AAC.2
MPLVVGGDDDVKIGSSTGAGGGQAFDLQTAQTLFWKPVPVQLRQADREDQHEELIFRILSGVSRANHNMRKPLPFIHSCTQILRIHISSESDLFFLHSLEVSEEDFQSLKNEQGILVDFASFPGKVITLLDRCINSLPTDAPSQKGALAVVHLPMSAFEPNLFAAFMFLAQKTLAHHSHHHARCGAAK